MRINQFSWTVAIVPHRDGTFAVAVVEHKWPRGEPYKLASHTQIDQKWCSAEEVRQWAARAADIATEAMAPRLPE